MVFKLIRIFIFIFIISIFLTPLYVHPAIYYVDIKGFDNIICGSIDSPCASLSYTCNYRAKSAGDIIYINPGIYVDKGYCMLDVGVSIQGAGKNDVIINCSVGHPSFGSYITLYSESETNGNQAIHDFSIDGGNSIYIMGIRSRGRNNVQFYNLGLSNFNKPTAPSGGMRVEGATDGGVFNEPSWYAKGVAIYNNTFTNTSYGTTSPPLHWGALEIEALEGATIYNNTFNESGPGRGVGIKNCNHGWFKGVDIFNNIINVNPSDGNAFAMEVYNFHSDSKIRNNIFNGPFSLNGGPSIRKAGTKWNLQIYGNTFNMSNASREMFIEASHNWLLFDRNFVVGEGKNCRGVGVWVTNYGKVSNVQISNNIVYNTGETGVYVDTSNGEVSNISIYNNTIDTINTILWGGFGLAVIGSSVASGIIAKNNIVRSAANRWLFLNIGAKDGIYTYNMRFNCGNSNNHYDNGIGNMISNNILADPQWVGSGVRPEYYKPSSGNSNIVNSGTPLPGVNDIDYIGVIRPQGGAWDIGAYEYTTIAPPKNLTIIRE